jgi:hypothetical protein
MHVACLVRLAGFEPTTPWFVAKYSIQLSYSRKQACPVVLRMLFQASAPRNLGTQAPYEATQHRQFPGKVLWCGWQDSNPRPLGS